MRSAQTHLGKPSLGVIAYNRPAVPGTVRRYEQGPHRTGAEPSLLFAALSLLSSFELRHLARAIPQSLEVHDAVVRVARTAR